MAIQATTIWNITKKNFIWQIEANKFTNVHVASQWFLNSNI